MELNNVNKEYTKITFSQLNQIKNIFENMDKIDCTKNQSNRPKILLIVIYRKNN